MGLILYENKIRGATALNVGTDSGSIARLTDGRTSTSELFNSGASREFTVDLGSAQSVDTLAFSRNNLLTVSGSIELQGSNDNSSFASITTNTPTSTSVSVLLFSSVSYRYYKVIISGHSAQAYLTDIAIGARVDLERDQKAGFIEPYYADSDQIIPNITDGNNIVGITVKRMPKRIKLNLFYYTKAFFDTGSQWSLMKSAMKAYPIYAVWDKANQRQAIYCWLYKNVPQPAYAANVENYSRMNVVIDLEGITE